jgi:hypothetical protein
MATIEITDRDLIVHIHCWDELLALRGALARAEVPELDDEDPHAAVARVLAAISKRT